MTQLDAALDLMRRLPPSQIEDNLAGLIDIVPDLTESLLSAVDQPLKIAQDKHSNRAYLLCDYNRDGDSYRSPWSNKYDPELEDGGSLPSSELRKFEIQANEVFDIYRELYYEGGLSSVFAWDLDDGFACCVLIKKTQDQSKKGQPFIGTWDSINVVEVKDSKKSATYKLTSTCMLSIETDTPSTGKVTLGGSLTRQDAKDFPVNEANSHVTNIGRMVEEMENKIRSTLEQIYFGKTKDIVNELRSVLDVAVTQQRKQLSQAINTNFGNRP